MKKTMKKSESHDVIICGAGSAGLSTAAFCARNGQKVLVLEKQAATGAFPRGETLRPDPVVDELLGAGFMDRISLNRTAKRRYWCPGGRKSFSLERENASYIFHWKDLTDALAAAAEAAGAEIRFNSEVVRPIIYGGRCIGVKLKDGSRCRGKTIVAADGHDSVLGRFFGVDYSLLNCPVAKRVCRGVESDYDGMEFFFITPGLIDGAPDFPPCIAFIFPRGGGRAEAGLMLLAGVLPEQKRKNLPDRQRIIDVLERLWTSYPVFSDRLKHAKVEFEGVAMIPMAGLHPEMSAVPGLLLAGDTVGLVEASGGCGIVATMKHAAFIAEFLAANPPDPWDEAMRQYLNRAFTESEIYHHIDGKYRKILPALKLAFGGWRPVFVFERLWDLMGFFYKKV